MLSSYDFGYITDVMEMLKTDRDKLSDWEKSFMADQEERFEQYGQDTRFSPKQMNIVKKCGQKLGVRYDDQERVSDPGLDDEIPF